MMRILLATTATVVVTLSNRAFVQGQETTPADTVDTTPGGGIPTTRWEEYWGPNEETVLGTVQSAAQKCMPDVYEMIVSTAPPIAPNADGTYPDYAEVYGEHSSNMLNMANQYFRELGQKGTCSDDDMAIMDAAFDEFGSCTGGLDMKSFIQYMPSALMGGAMECAMSIAATNNLFNPEYWMSGEALPDQCAEVFFGSNVLGDMMRTYYLKPSLVTGCLADLSTAVPECFYDMWPVGIVGSWMKSASCFIGELTPLISAICKSELSVLNECLSTAEAANDICSAQDACKDGSYNMNMMPPFLGAPMPDQCLNVATEEGMQGAVDLYNQFVIQCTTPWEGWGASIQPPATDDSSSAGASPNGGGDESAAQDEEASSAGTNALGAAAGLVALLAVMAI